MFDCTLTEVEVWADDASNFRTRWRFYNRMKERKVDAAAQQPLVLPKKYFLPNVMQLKDLTVSKLENFDPFVQWNMTLRYSKHILSHLISTR